MVPVRDLSGVPWANVLLPQADSLHTGRRWRHHLRRGINRNVPDPLEPALMQRGGEHPTPRTGVFTVQLLDYYHYRTNAQRAVDSLNNAVPERLKGTLAASRRAT
jgi:hypothetical protein